ncbi:MAG: YbaB/EbfC family nucleoid-associated protein [Schaalia hyovaginalis]|uniref:YbaB/EbfC family nucleoid-associated protein n=1 Tax=Schaalia hyovaginalis TaxID=29316 RepID=UPI002A915B83|nr:YbaB/EbfC family nucleoid-associated protein [Schaalia hyovaginalis]MDY6214361.1 YbaB/EbfC family nucleoid-associated protein [Schaalia hyovaginalis]
MGDVEEAYARLEAVRARAERQLREAQDRKDRFAQVSRDAQSHAATVRSPRGEVEVTAQATGRILNLTFSSNALALGSEKLAALVTETIARAQHDAATQGITLMSSVLPGDSPFYRSLSVQIEDTFPAPPTRPTRGCIIGGSQ